MIITTSKKLEKNPELKKRVLSMQNPDILSNWQELDKNAKIELGCELGEVTLPNLGLKIFIGANYSYDSYMPDWVVNWVCELEKEV